MINGINAVNFERLIGIVIVIFVFTEWYYFTKDTDVNESQKVLYTIIDAIHIIAMLSVIFLGTLIFAKQNQCFNLIILNSIWFLAVILFLHFKRCILSVMSAEALGSEVLFSDPRKRIKLLLGKLTPQEYKDGHYQDPNDPETYSDKWMKGNKLPLTLVFICNLYCFYHLKV